MGEHDRELRVAPERGLPDEALVEHAAERVDVCLPVDLLPRDLLRGDVVDRAQQVVAVSASGLLRDPSRQAEVGQVGVVGAIGTSAPIEEDVRGLHVEMDETAGVRGIQRARGLRDDADRIRRVEAASAQAPMQVTPLDVAHGDEEEVFGRPRLVDRDDVRMVDRRSQLRLPQEAVAKRLILRKTGREQLQRHPPLEPQVLGQVDDAHPAEAQHRLDPVPGELGADPRVFAHLHVPVLAVGTPQGNDRTTQASL